MSEINKDPKASGSEQRQHRHAADTSQGAAPYQSAAEARAYASRNNASAQDSIAARSSRRSSGQHSSEAPSPLHTSAQHATAASSQPRSSQKGNNDSHRHSSSSLSSGNTGSSNTVRSTPPRREFTPSQRRRIEEARRRRQLQRIVVVISAVLVLVVVTTGIVLGVRHKDSEVTEVADLPATTQQSVSETVESTQTDSTPEPSVESTSEASEEPVTYSPENGTFVFDDAYVAAALGAVTGPDLVPDMTSIDPAKSSRWPALEEGRIPVLMSANTTQPVIAVTVDDCFQASNLRDIVQCALNNNSKLTIFPIGRNLQKEEIASAVKWAWEQGMEIENHSFKHAGTYAHDDEYMTSDIWTQSYLLNSVLGVNYKEHFFRPMGGNEHKDQRTHAYVHQLGMKAIAMWSVTGSTNSIEFSTSRLEPGAIYLFHTTDSDRSLLLEFIPYAVQQGYQLVTLNELFGLPDNEVSDLSTAPQDKPPLESFKVIPMQLSRMTYARAAAVVQKRLIELGWLDGEADSVFGQSSYIATGYFQQAANIKADGIAGPSTQAALFSEDAPRKN